MNKDKCMICGSDNVQMIHLGVRDNKDINVYKCMNCGTKYLDDISYRDYENDYMYQTEGLSDLDVSERMKSCEKDDYRRANMLKELIKEKDVLDFGCGYGGFLENIFDKANSIKGVEAGRKERLYLESKGVVCKKEIEEYTEKFDVITLFHVLEHLEDPRIWLRRIMAYLKRDGYLVIEVPNGDDALLELYHCEKFADFTYWSAHLFLYTMRSLKKIINEIKELEIVSASQVQRYPLANHLYWLAEGKPGGDKVWNNMNSAQLNKEYENKLKELEMCDTLFFILKKK